MLYTASDAINLVYKIIGKTLALMGEGFKNDKEKQKQVALNLKEFYRYSMKKRVHTESEIISCGETFNWNFISESELVDLKKLFLENCLITTTENHYLDHEYVVQELNKLYDKALENTFIVDREMIDWDKTIKMIESRFLSWVHAKNLKQDKDLKEKLLSIMANLNEKEEVSYYSKYNILIETLRNFKKFVEDYENGIVAPTPENHRYYEKSKISMDGLKFMDEKDFVVYLDYDQILDQLQKLPDNSELWDFNFTLELNIRIFFSSILSNIITSQTISVWGAKAEMIRSNGGWLISREKESFKNLYIALTQSNEKIQSLISLSTKRLNRNLIQLVKDLMIKFKNKSGDDLYNPVILNSYFEQIDKLIKYHEAGVADSFLSHPNEMLDGFNIKSADALLDFENMSRIADALVELDSNLSNQSKGDLLRTIEFIKKISDLEEF
ncbi:hypothetical protein [Spiroplasma monobiae]|uniref:Uncharacterized protein n=1 Tax=Spiroplasma monobiae MQ-1 TaxID=1336748 RepID=A0A2K9LUF8_SPISQ|nr:hypothetical protein [Spiroplasma monobiae]AUM62551.1 hypothetical protein SMONO_v1c03020 [Spiroplasma monobiae MQ-1]